MFNISVLLEDTPETPKPKYAVDVAQPIVLWLTVGIISALLVAGLIIFFAKRKIFGKYVKIAGLGAVIYCVVLGIVMLSLEIAKQFSVSYTNDSGINRSDIITKVLVPLVIVCGVILICAAALVVIYKFRRNAFKIAGFICGVLVLAAVIVAAILIGTYYRANISDDGYYNSDTASVNNLALYLSMSALLAIIVLAAIFLGKGGKKGFDTKTIAYASVCIALSFALSYIKIFEMPQGGSVTLASLLPLMVFAYMYGIRKGLFAGFIYGMLQSIQDPFIIHPAQFFLDYPIAFAFIGLAGIFANIHALDKVPQVKFALGAIVACSLRFVSHVLSGVFAFSTYAGEANSLVYSMAYNSFVFIDMLITIAAGALVFSSKSFVKLVSQYNRPAKATDTVTEQSQKSADGSVTSETDGLTHTDSSAKDDK